MDESMTTYAVDSTTEFLTALFLTTGMPEPDARFTAGCMLQTNLWGVESHGVLRAPSYWSRVRSGGINPAPQITTVAGSPEKALEVIDGDGGMGYVVAREGMERAIGKAHRFGTGTVLARNSNHFGAAALFARMAADRGLIGVAATNVMPNIGMRGNRKPCTGNNPVAMAAPLFDEYPFCLDIAMSQVSGGKLILAAKKGEKIPTNWAVTADGLDTDDPDAGFKGFLLPFGMHKGFGLSLFVDIVTGVLSGGAFSRHIKSMYKHPDEPSDTCHTFYAVDPECIMAGEEFSRRMRAWAAMVKATPMVEDGAEQIIPGELEYQSEVRCRREGIVLPSELVEDLKATAAEAGVPFNLSQVKE